MSRCSYDSGSMTDCRPLCSDIATHAVKYHNGSGPAFIAEVCRYHFGPMQGRAYPGVDAAGLIGEVT